MRKNGFKKDLMFFMFISLISNHTVFLDQFGLICTCEILKKAEIAFAARLAHLSLNYLMQLD